MYGKFKDHLQKQLDAIVTEGLYKTERILTTPQGVEIRTDKLAKNVCMTSPFIRGEFSDNYFDLLPGEKRTILYKTDINNPNFGSFLRLQTVYTACKKK